jgi:hypothetical protein
MVDLDEYLRDIEQRRIPDLRAQPELLEAGRMSIGERRGGGSWTDTTQAQIYAPSPTTRQSPPGFARRCDLMP